MVVDGGNLTVSGLAEEARSSSESESFEAEGHGGDPECPNCQGVGFTLKQINEKGEKRVVLCPCRANEILRRKIKAAKIPVEFRDPKLVLSDEVEVDLQAGRIIRVIDPKEFLKSYVSDLAGAINDRIHLRLVGPNGTGKTLFSTKILIEALRQGYKGRFATHQEIIDLCFNDKDGANRREMDEILSAEVLVLDEYGKHFGSEWALAETENFLRYRLSSRGVTIITTNFKERVAETAAPGKDQIHLMSIQSLFDGIINLHFYLKDDYRLKKSEQVLSRFASSFRSDLGTETEKRRAKRGRNRQG